MHSLFDGPRHKSIESFFQKKFFLNLWKKVENKIKKRANKLLLKNSTQSYKKKVVDLKDITDYQNKAQEHKRLTFRLSNPTKWIKKKKN